MKTRLSKFVAWTLGAGVILWLGAWLFVRSPAGPAFVVRLIHTLTRGRVLAEGPSGAWPFRGARQRVTVAGTSRPTAVWTAFFRRR